MSWTRRFGPSTLAVGVSLFGLGLLGGCGGGENKVAGSAAKISPEMEKKTNEMLQDYGKRYDEQFKAAAAAKKKK
jgi:hypothetical protein